MPPLALADMIAGYSGVGAAMMALREAERGTGKGQVVDLALFDPIFATLGPAAAEFQMLGKTPERSGSRSKLSCPRNVYPCRDGKFVCLSASVQSVAERLFHAIGRPELITDPRFATNEARVRHRRRARPDRRRLHRGDDPGRGARPFLRRRRDGRPDLATSPTSWSTPTSSGARC